MKKVLRIMALCLILVMSFTVIASAEEIQPMSSGYEVYNIKHMGRSYTATISAAYTDADGATVRISSEASIWARMDDTHATFKTRNHGSVEEVGGRQYSAVRLNNPNVPANSRIGSLATSPVRCRYGENEVIGSPGIFGSGDIETLTISEAKNPPYKLHV